MASIQWYWFLIIGFVVAGIAMLNPSLILFRFVGIFLVIYGIGKIAYEKVMGKALPDKNSAFPPKTQQPQSQYKICAQCKKHLALEDAFCKFCGAPQNRSHHLNHHTQQTHHHTTHAHPIQHHTHHHHSHTTQHRNPHNTQHHNTHHSTQSHQVHHPHQKVHSRQN